MQEEYEIQVTLPVRYRNVPPDISFIQTPPREIRARIKDKGSVLLNYTVGQNFSGIDINMKDIPEKNGVVLFSEKEVESGIMKQLIATTNLLSFEPRRIEAPYGIRMNKTVPVVFDGRVHTEPGFFVCGDIVVDPPIVEVYAADAVLDTLRSVKTVHTEITRGDKTLTRLIQLQKIDGVSIEPNAVSITVPIEEFTEKTLEIPVVCTGTPSRYTIRTFPAVVKITGSVPLSRFKELTEADFSMQVSFDDMKQNVSGVLPVRLTEKPDWVRNITVSPDSVEFILEQSGEDD
ncbi:MAG: YbbR-like domain-containing protein [Tannerellaceae bacterium]|nr:YbbR-like domain-containing protein [Tannerellaceae bacterium]